MNSLIEEIFIYAALLIFAVLGVAGALHGDWDALLYLGIILAGIAGTLGCAWVYQNGRRVLGKLRRS